MKPVLLEFSNIGPYAGQPVRIPFDRMERLFLVAGDTGAGKTSIFDAVCFALYGKPLGTREKAGAVALRSQLAPATESSWVRLSFECGGQRWRVYRSPFEVREKKRGGGVKKPEEVVALWRWVGGRGEDGWEPINAKGQVIDARLRDEILHLSHDEFSKIVVLPQGQFQQFLEMESSQRASMLEKLFPTVEHRRLTDLATSQVNDLRKAIEGLESRQNELRLEFDPDAFDSAARQLQQQERERVARAAAAQGVARNAAELLEAGRNLERTFAALAQAEGELARLESARQLVTTAEDELGRARRAESVSPAQRQCERLSKLVAERHVELERIRETCGRLESERIRQQPALDALPARVEAGHTLIERRERALARGQDLKSLVAALAGAREAAARHVQAVAAVAPLEQSLADARADVESLAPVAEQREQTLKRIDEASATVHRLESLSTAAQDWTAWQRRVAPGLQQQLAQARAVLQAAHDAETQATAARDDVAGRLHQQAAVSLAATLHEGEPCPVCGALVHPHPAVGQEHGIGTQALRSAEESLEQRRRSRAEAERVASACDEKLAAQREHAERAQRALAEAGFGDVEDYERERGRAAGVLAELRATSARLRQSIEARPRLEAVVEMATRKLTAARERVAGAEVDVARRDAEAAALTARVGSVEDPGVALRAAEDEARRLSSELRRENDDIQALRERATRAAAELAAALQARSSLETELAALERETADARGQLELALSEARFRTLDEVTEALRPPQRVRDLEAHIKDWQQRRHGAEVRCVTLREQIEKRARPDLVGLELTATQAEQEARACSEAQARVTQELALLGRRRTRWGELLDERARLEGDGRGLLALARDLAGDNPRRLDFPTFILVWWLEQVLVRASSRLLALSSGRYRFVLQDSVFDRRSRAGLDIDVHDAYSGGRRSVRTLSGGEKFMASLSLALGLSDIIQERAGGIELDTLFIDEGFGSLDAEALDRALTVLDELGAHRTVGVISHVETMKSAIPCRVLVEKTPAGSRITLENLRPASSPAD